MVRRGASYDEVMQAVAEGDAEATELATEVRTGATPVVPKEKAKWLIIFAAMGPGIITAMAGNDAGGIATYSQVGALFGYKTLWALPIMCVLLIVAVVQLIQIVGTQIARRTDKRIK